MKICLISQCDLHHILKKVLNPDVHRTSFQDDYEVGVNYYLPFSVCIFLIFFS